MDSSHLDPLNAKPGFLRLSSELLKQMRDEVIAKAPEEACGLLAGLAGQGGYQALEAIPVTNSLHSRYRYRMDPQEQLQALMHIEARGWELVATYHSHPNGPDQPSPSDIAEAYYPESVYLIWSKRTDEWVCRGYLIQNGQVERVPLRIDERI
jgi:proteasome lid subunit RPN8/RPN11